MRQENTRKREIGMLRGFPRVLVYRQYGLAIFATFAFFAPLRWDLH